MGWSEPYRIKENGGYTPCQQREYQVLKYENSLDKFLF